MAAQFAEQGKSMGKRQREDRGKRTWQACKRARQEAVSLLFALPWPLCLRLCLSNPLGPSGSGRGTTPHVDPSLPARVN